MTRPYPWVRSLAGTAPSRLDFVIQLVSHPLALLLSAQTWKMYGVELLGGGNHDLCRLTTYRYGDIHQSYDTTYGYELYAFVKHVGFDVVSLSTWAGFGINPCELGGTRYNMDHRIPVLNPADFVCEELPAELEITESFATLQAAAADGGAQAVARLALASLYRDTEHGSMYDAEEVYADLKDGTPLKQALSVVFKMAGRRRWNF